MLPSAGLWPELEWWWVAGHIFDNARGSAKNAAAFTYIGKEAVIAEEV